MENTNLKEMETSQIIGTCVWLDREGKKNRALLNSYKAELQARGIAEMDDHNVKYVKFYGEEGNASIMDSMSLDILNPDKLMQLVGEGVWKTKVKEDTMLFVILPTSTYPFFLQIKRRYSIILSDVLSVRLFYPVPSCAIIT